MKKGEEDKNDETEDGFKESMRVTAFYTHCPVISPSPFAIGDCEPDAGVEQEADAEGGAVRIDGAKDTRLGPVVLLAKAPALTTPFGL
jgi:hypothetical protein